MQDIKTASERGYSLRSHQLMMLSLLRELDRICKKHGIKYMLFAGTALGAVRHSGFIPWDDDLDVIMQRSEYERFLKIAPTELSEEDFFLQAEFSEHWPMYFSKLRRNNTACIERCIPRDEKMHQGVYIDIFPCDRLSDIGLVRRLQFFASRVVVAKALQKRGYLTKSLIKRLFMAVCRILPQKPFLRLAQLKGRECSKALHCFLAAASRYKRSVFPRQWLEKTVEIRFEDGMYPISEHWDSLLRQLYGDYMSPTPECERGSKKHAELVDLNNSYEEYIGIQRRMKFSEYTRSIR